MTIVANTFPSFPGIASKPGNTDFHSPSWHRWVGYPCAAKQALLGIVFPSHFGNPNSVLLWPGAIHT
jgi:hypothetical protein